MLFELPFAFQRSGGSDTNCPSTWGIFDMRPALHCIAVLAAAVPATSWAQDAEPQPARRTIVFDATADIAAGEPVAEQAAEQDDDGDWGIAVFQAEQQAANAAPDFDSAVQARRLQQQRAVQHSACATQSDILISGASSRPRYDANGAVIRPPAASCAPPPAAAASAARVTSESAGRVAVATESSGGCTEDRLTGTRTCRSAGSISIGTSDEAIEDARRAAQEAIDRLRDD
jgi:hypothetical protein